MRSKEDSRGNQVEQTKSGGWCGELRSNLEALEGF